MKIEVHAFKWLQINYSVRFKRLKVQPYDVLAKKFIVLRQVFPDFSDGGSIFFSTIFEGKSTTSGGEENHLFKDPLLRHRKFSDERGVNHLFEDPSFKFSDERGGITFLKTPFSVIEINFQTYRRVTFQSPRVTLHLFLQPKTKNSDKLHDFHNFFITTIIVITISFRHTLVIGKHTELL